MTTVFAIQFRVQMPDGRLLTGSGPVLSRIGETIQYDDNYCVDVKAVYHNALTGQMTLMVSEPIKLKPAAD